MYQTIRILILHVLGWLGLLVAMFSLLSGFGFTKVFAYSPECEFSISQKAGTLGNTIALQTTIFNHYPDKFGEVYIYFKDTHVNRYGGSYSDWTSYEDDPGIRFNYTDQPIQVDGIATFSTTINFDQIGPVRVHAQMGSYDCVDIGGTHTTDIPIQVNTDSMSNQTTTITRHDVDLISLCVAMWLCYKVTMLFVFRGTE